MNHIRWPLSYLWVTVDIVLLIYSQLKVTVKMATTEQYLFYELYEALCDLEYIHPINEIVNEVVMNMLRIIQLWRS